MDSSLRETVDLGSRFALSRFSERIRSAEVQLADINGPRGGVDKRCRIVVRMLPTGTVIVEDKDADAHAAVARASERVARAVTRELERRRERRKQAARTRCLFDSRQNLV